MPLDSLNEARELWKKVSDYYSLYDDKKIFTYLWQAAVERVNELKEHEDAAAEYSIEKISSTEKKLWCYIENVDNDYIVDSEGNSIADNVISIPTLQDGINSPDNTYIEGTNYSVSGQKITWITAQPSDTYLYAPEVIIENVNVAKYFNNGFMDLILTNFTYVQKKEILRLVWYVAKFGPTEHNMLALIHALAGIPFNRYPAIGKISGGTYIMHYSIPAYGLIADGSVKLGTDKSEHTVDITGNMVINSSSYLSVNDHVYYGGTYYSVIEIIGSDALLDKTIENVSGVDITTYSYLSMIIAENCILLDQDSGIAYGLYPDVIFPDKELLLVHQNNIAYNDEDLAYIKEKREILSPYSTFSINFTDGDILYPFTNLQKAFYIRSWEDNYIDSGISGYDDDLRVDILKAIYNVEVDRVYSIKDELSGTGDTFELHNSDDIESGDSLLIKNYISGDEYDVTDKEIDDDGYWWVTTGNNYAYAGRQQVMIRKLKTVGSDSFYVGGMAIILEGIYDAIDDTYKLKLNMDLSSSDYDSGVKIVILNIIEHTRVIESIASNIVTLNAELEVEQDMLPVVTKSAYANYGDHIKRVLSSAASSGDSTISISALPSGEKYNYILIAGTSREAEICEISNISGDTVTLKDALDNDYESGDIVILLKRLPIHGGITFEKYTTGNYTTMITDYPNLVTNINKVLDKILPAGYSYRWRVW